MGFRFLRNGDKAITMELGDCVDEQINRHVTAICRQLQSLDTDGILDVIPTFRSLTVCYEPDVISDWNIKRLLKRCYRKSGNAESAAHRVVCIPVCYGGAYGPDLADVAAFHGVSEEQVIQMHSGRDYLIYMLGFLPGFAYLGGLDKMLATPRLDSPRVRIEPGSVGIGGEQTGIYPMASPGGWRLIGRTPLSLYDAEKENSVPYEAGEYIRFVPITPEQYEQIASEVSAGTYQILMEESR